MSQVPPKPKDLEDEKNVFSASGKLQLVALFAVMVAAPTVLLFIRGVVDQRTCGAELTACYARCANDFRDLVIVFESQRRGQQECEQNCQTQAATCRSRASAVIGAAGVLVGGVAGSSLLVCCLDSILRRLGATAQLAVARPRPAYQEPIFTEEEKRKMRGFLGFLRRKEEPFRTVETKCRECDIVVDVDERWITGGIGGMEGAVCPKCRQVIVGLV